MSSTEGSSDDQSGTQQATGDTGPRIDIRIHSQDLVNMKPDQNV